MVRVRIRFLPREVEIARIIGKLEQGRADGFGDIQHRQSPSCRIGSGDVKLVLQGDPDPGFLSVFKTGSDVRFVSLNRLLRGPWGIRPKVGVDRRGPQPLCGEDALTDELLALFYIARKIHLRPGRYHHSPEIPAREFLLDERELLQLEIMRQPELEILHLKLIRNIEELLEGPVRKLGSRNRYPVCHCFTFSCPRLSSSL